MANAKKAGVKSMKTKRPPIVSGVIWLGIGLFLLAGQRGMVNDLDMDQLWPLFIILIGVAVIVGAVKRSSSAKESS